MQNKQKHVSHITENQGLFCKVRVCMQYDQKRQESPVKGHICGFVPFIFPNLEHVDYWVFSREFSVESKAFHFSKKALRAGTARNKWLKKALKMR